MKIVIIGGTGLIGSKTTERLRKQGSEVIAAAPNTGVNTITGEGLQEALEGAEVVIDLANSPSFEDKASMDFFTTSGRNLLAAGKVAGIRHHIALSVVGTERLQDCGYFRAKLVQENLIKASGIPYTIVHSTQFMEFLAGIAKSGTVGEAVHLSPAYVQPIASDDVADVMAGVALAAPINGMIEISGPDRVRMSELVARYLKAVGDPREVVADPEALYFGARLNDTSLVSDNNPRLGHITFEQWFAASARKSPPANAAA
ncbi:MAG: SDR family oxidoreductase [Mesorhizobium sp.]|nr:MAG: SDR family oxidoreductase [Mesorhizobium sp.]